MSKKVFDVSIVIPWRKTEQRDRNEIADWCFKRYEYLFPHAEIILSDSGSEIFSRGESINKGVSECNGDYVIITDADYLFSSTMASELINKQPWTIAVKQENYFYINRITTRRILKQPFNVDIKDINFTDNVWECQYFIYGGVLAMPKNNFIKFDNMFSGYGYEDNQLFYCMKAYHGKPFRTNNKMYHLFHDRIASEDYMKKSYDNKKYHDEVWLPIQNNKKEIRKLVEQKELYKNG